MPTSEKARYNHRGARLEEELESILKILRALREQLEANILSNKEKYLDKGAVIASKELSLAYARLVEAQIKLDKNQKELAEIMTVEEQRDVIRSFIRAMPHAERGTFLRHEVNYHNSRGVVNPAADVDEE